MDQLHAYPFPCLFGGVWTVAGGRIDLGVEYQSFVGSATDLPWFLDPVTKQRDCEDGLGAGPRGCESQLCHL